MSVCFSGAYTDSNLARKVYEFFESKYTFMAYYVVEIYHCDLTDDNVKGWQEKNDDDHEHIAKLIKQGYDQGELIQEIEDDE